MTRLVCWTLLILLGTCAAWGAAPPTPAAAPTPATVMKDLQRNAALGEALTHRQGSADELALVQKLADRGLQGARDLAAKNPDSAEAQYLLGSWILYGYRVIERENVSFDTGGGEHREKTREVARGLSDSPTEGLKYLQSAHTLAPENGRYFVDYGAALYDCDLPDEAMSALKKVWLSTLKLTPADRMRTALLMSDLLANQGEVSGAREWMYRALLLDPKNAELVPLLPRFDHPQTETLVAPPPASAPPPPAAEPESAPPAEQEVAPSDEGTTQEAAPEASEDTSGDELAPESGAGDSGDNTSDGNEGAAQGAEGGSGG